MGRSALAWVAHPFLAAGGGTALDGVGHGSLLAGRYRLEERVRTGADGSLWRAVDETLDRPVSVRVVRPGHRYTADVIDAARRAALVEDARLVRVLDVGESGGSAFIVSEHLVGRTLEELLVTGPIPAETVRRLVGEAAQALDRASARGLHHLQLTPSSLVVAPDGNVKVLGTAVEAALAGVEHDEDPLGADRLDAIGLVRVLYAGLTGRWPGHVDGPLGPAPRVTGRTVPPGDLVAGTPNDLDTLCTVTLGPHDDGPHSPGELAAQLAPWGLPEPIGTSRRLTAAAPRQQIPATTEARAAQAHSVLGVNGSDQVAPATPASTIAGAGGKVVRHATPAKGVPAAPEPALPTLLPRDVVAPDTVVDLSSPPVAVSAASPSTNGSNASNTPVASHGRDPAHGSVPVGSPQGRESGGDGDGLRLLDRDVDDWALLSRPSPPPTGNPPAPDSEPLGPFIPPAPVARPPKDQARFVLSVVAGLVVIGLILAVFSLRGLFGSADPLVQPSPLIPSPTATVTRSAGGAAPPPAAVASPSDSGTASPAVVPAEISGIQAIDPQGDGDENGSTADRAIDDDPSTSWRSARYQSQSFGGLKDGLGLYLLVTGGAVTTVTVEMPGRGGTVQLLTARGPGLDGSAVVATAQASGGSAALTPAQPVSGTSLLLWFTELPQQDSGEYRLVVSEIKVS